MAGTTGLEPAASAVTEGEQQVLPTTYKAVGDCQVLGNTPKPNESRVGVRIELMPSWVSLTCKIRPFPKDQAVAGSQNPYDCESGRRIQIFGH